MQKINPCSVIFFNHDAQTNMKNIRMLFSVKTTERMDWFYCGIKHGADKTEPGKMDKYKHRIWKQKKN